MEDPIQYSFNDYTTDDILTQIREADEECKRITQRRYNEMSSYEDDEMYDEIQNWKSQAVTEVNKRKEASEDSEDSEDSETDDYDDYDTTDYNFEYKNPEQTYTLPPLNLDEIKMAYSILEEKKSKMGTLPTLDEYWAMSEGERCRWACLHCCKPAVEGATIPGSYCSVLCAASKYS